MTSSGHAENERGVAGAGALLREAREARGLSTLQVAGKLRLDVRHIETMERDEYTQLVAPVFVRGYLRSYARFLNLSPDTIVISYENRKGPVPKVMHGRSIFSDDDPIEGNNRLHWVIYSVVLVSLILGVVWWQTQEDPALEDIEPELSDAPAVANSPPANTAKGTTAPAQGALNTDQTKSTAVTAPPVAPTAADPAASPAAGAASTTATSAQAPQVNPAMPSVTLHVTVDSWVEISDAEGKRLIYKVLSAGATQTLEEFKLPLKVVLGKASGVRLDYNGTPFDHSSYQRNGVARFELGTASTNPSNN